MRNAGSLIVCCDCCFAGFMCAAAYGLWQLPPAAGQCTFFQMPLYSSFGKSYDISRSQRLCIVFMIVTAAVSAFLASPDTLGAEGPADLAATHPCSPVGDALRNSSELWLFGGAAPVLGAGRELLEQKHPYGYAPAGFAFWTRPGLPVLSGVVMLMPFLVLVLMGNGRSRRRGEDESGHATLGAPPTKQPRPAAAGERRFFPQLHILPGLMGAASSPGEAREGPDAVLSQTDAQDSCGGCCTSNNSAGGSSTMESVDVEDGMESEASWSQLGTVFGPNTLPTSSLSPGTSTTDANSTDMVLECGSIDWDAPIPPGCMLKVQDGRVVLTSVAAPIAPRSDLAFPRRHGKPRAADPALVTVFISGKSINK